VSTVFAQGANAGAIQQRGQRLVHAARRGGLLLALCIIALICETGVAVAAPAWRVWALSNPSTSPGAQVEYVIAAKNLGNASAPETAGGDSDNCVPGAPPPSDASKCYSVTGTFPGDVTPTSVEGFGGTEGTLPGDCAIDGGTNSVTCSWSGSTTDEQVPPGGPQVSMMIVADVNPAASGELLSTFEVSGAGGSTHTAVDPLVVSATSPEFGLSDFDGQVAADAAGAPFTQAGGHPYQASTAIEFNAITHPDPLIGPRWPIEPPKTLAVDLPPGFVGDPTAVDRCSVSDLGNTVGHINPRPLCPPTSQIGTTVVILSNGAASVFGPLPVFNLEPTEEVPARFGFNILGTVVLLDAEVRSDDNYGVSVIVRNAPEAAAVQATEVTLWGVPSDPSHDGERACPGETEPANGGPTCTSGAPRSAFLRNPTMCTPDGAGLVTTVRAASWIDPTDFKSKSFLSHLPPAYPAPPSAWGRAQGTTGCERVPFRPTLSGAPPTDATAGAPSSFAFDLAVPQPTDPEIIGTSDLKKAVVTLPRGVRVSPSSADGLAGCSSAQVALHSRADATCPDASRVGSLTVRTPLLEEPLEGGIYLATPFDNPSDSLIALYLIARGPGFALKIPGRVSPDPSSGGQLTTTFDNNPQLPFSNLHLEFNSGPRAPVVLPKRCGTYLTQAGLTSWSGKTVDVDSSFTVNQGCGGGFRPQMEAGTQNPVAGRSSPFRLRVTREDSDEELKALSIHTPSGLTGRIADVDLCGDLDARNGTCRESARVGSVTVGSGAGTNPFYITSGRAYLTDSYRGCDFGLSIVVPAIAGPFDLGTVVVRSAVCVDKHTAELTVASDELPTQLQGIPLDMKDVRVNIDREGFFLNPTSCEEKAITGVIESLAGSKADVSSRFQVGDCAALPLRPRMTLVVGGRGRTQRGRTTPFTATLRQGPGQAGLSRVRVTLPTTINARLTVINDACTRAEFEAGRCEDARTGTATAKTPLLDAPLRGGVYFVRNGHPLPDLFVALRGQVDFDLIGRITIPGSKRLRTSFNAVPDVPVSSFQLRLNGGRQGSVGNAANLCSRRGRSARAELSFVGQNGKQVNVRQRLTVRGCKARAGRRGRSFRRRGRR